MDRIEKSFCLDCGWTARTDTVDDRSREMVEHHVSTGHEIDSVWRSAVSQHDAVDSSTIGP
jgi:predicted small metal-binding protein